MEFSKVIISASGMCEAGRIKHHLKHNLWRQESTIVFAGYQAAGTLGRRILDGAETVKIFGEEINVNARIETLEGMSSHADEPGLIEWLSCVKEKPKMVMLTHGEITGMTALGKKLGELGYQYKMPALADMFDTDANELIGVGTITKTQEMVDYSKEIRKRLLEEVRGLETAVADSSNMLKRSDDAKKRELADLLANATRLIEEIKQIEHIE